MTTQHTPGPWEVHSRQPTFIRANGGRKHIASTASLGDDEESRANSWLIAAAPELLAALTQFLDQEGNPPENTGEWREVLRVIAKATGRAA